MCGGLPSSETLAGERLETTSGTINYAGTHGSIRVVRYLALASDYDGTLAHDGVVDAATIEALERLRHSGRKLILVTGRELPDLESVFTRLDLFERIVAENGAVLYNPRSHEKRLLAQRPPGEFVENLRRRGVQNVSFGDVIIAAWRPCESAAIEGIRESGLELQIVFNKDAVMILPSGTNKMTGLSAALDDLKLSRHNIVGVGDAENDHAFLGCCECSVAVANAIPALKQRADWITQADHGAGVSELIERMLADDLAFLDSTLLSRGRRSGAGACHGTGDAVSHLHHTLTFLCQSLRLY